MDPLPIQLIALTICGLVAAAIAANKGRSAIGWFFGGFFLGILGIIIVAVLSNLKTQREKEMRIERENRRLREQIRQEQIKGESFRQHASARLDAHDGHLGLDTRTALPERSLAALQLEAFGGASLELSDGAGDPDALDEFRGPDAVESRAADPIPSQSPPPPPRRRRQWHYEGDGQTVGPVDEGELLRLVRSGRITGSTLLWTEGFDDWRPAESVTALRPHLSL